MAPNSEFWDPIFDVVASYEEEDPEEEVGFVVVSSEFMRHIESTGGLDFVGTITVENVEGPIWEMSFESATG